MPTSFNVTSVGVGVTKERNQTLNVMSDDRWGSVKGWVGDRIYLYTNMSYLVLNLFEA